MKYYNEGKCENKNRERRGKVILRAFTQWINITKAA